MSRLGAFQIFSASRRRCLQPSFPGGGGGPRRVRKSIFPRWGFFLRGRAVAG